MARLMPLVCRGRTSGHVPCSGRRATVLPPGQTRRSDQIPAAASRRRQSGQCDGESRDWARYPGSIRTAQDPCPAVKPQINQRGWFDFQRRRLAQRAHRRLGEILTDFDEAFWNIPARRTRGMAERSPRPVGNRHPHSSPCSGRAPAAPFVWSWGRIGEPKVARPCRLIWHLWSLTSTRWASTTVRVGG